jgi:hypothetical protein
VSLQRIAESLGRVGSKEDAAHTNSGEAGAAPARHRQLDFDADSIEDGGRDEDNDKEHDDALEATQALPVNPEEEEEAPPEGIGSEDIPRDQSFDSQETESSSEDDPADETFVPESEENTEEATETESEESAEDAPLVKSRTRGRTQAAPARSLPRCVECSVRVVPHKANTWKLWQCAAANGEVDAGRGGLPPQRCPGPRTRVMEEDSA